MGIDMIAVMNDKEAQMTSLEIAELTGKMHKHVIRDIQVMVAALKKDGPILDHEEIQGVMISRDTRGYVSQIALNKNHTLCLISGYEPKLRMAIINRWDELENQYSIPKTFGEALQLAANQAFLIEQQQEEIKQKDNTINSQLKQLNAQKPAVDFLNRYVASDDTKSIREVAKLFGVGERIFVDALLQSKILFRQSGTLYPFSNYQHRGYFEIKAGEKNGYTFQQTRFTTSGIKWIAKKI